MSGPTQLDMRIPVSFESFCRELFSQTTGFREIVRVCALCVLISAASNVSAQDAAEDSPAAVPYRVADSPRQNSATEAPDDESQQTESNGRLAKYGPHGASQFIAQSVFQIQTDQAFAGDISLAFYPGPLGQKLFNRGQTPAPKYSTAGLSLEQKIDFCIRVFGINELEDASDRSPWGIMHAAISFGQESRCKANGRTVNALEWLENNGQCRGERLMYVKDGHLKTRSGPGFEGHEGQLLAILAQSGVSPHEELHVDGQRFTIVDLIKKEMDSCRPDTELTFKLIGLSYYLDADAEWKSDDGQDWTISRLITEELKQPIIGVACGGTHRLMGLTFCVQRRKLQEKEIVGEWQRAEEFIQDYIQYALSLQNPDGSFSTKWFEGREAIADPQRRLQTTGHILEWLVFALSVEELKDPHIVRSVDYLAELMLSDGKIQWNVGPKGHALRALALYKRRFYRGETVPTAQFGEPRSMR